MSFQLTFTQIFLLGGSTSDPVTVLGTFDSSELQWMSQLCGWSCRQTGFHQGFTLGYYSLADDFRGLT